MKIEVKIAEDLADRRFFVVKNNNSDEGSRFSDEGLLDSRIEYMKLATKYALGILRAYNVDISEIHFIFQGNGCSRYISAWLTCIYAIKETQPEYIDGIEFIFHLNKTFTPGLYKNMLDKLVDCVTIDPTEEFSFLYDDRIESYRLDENDSAVLVK